MSRPRSRARAGAVALVAVAALAVGCSSGGTVPHAVVSSRTAAPPSSTQPAPVPAPSTSAPPTSSAPVTSSAPTHPTATPVVTRTAAPSTITLTPSTPTTTTAAGAPLVVLDPGHDGGNAAHVSQIDRLVYAGYGKDKPCNTTGTETDAGYPEHAFTWDVSNRVRTILQAHGVRVRLTRDSDTGVGPCVDERARLESAKGVTLSVAIHADGAPAAGHGFHVNEDSRRPEGASAATVARTGTLCRDLHAALVSSSGLVPSTYIGSDGYFYRTDLAGLNLTTTPTSFLELGNMRNAHDAALQSSPAGRQRIADAVAAGILAYLGR